MNLLSRLRSESNWIGCWFTNVVERTVRHSSNGGKAISGDDDDYSRESRTTHATTRVCLCVCCCARKQREKVWLFRSLCSSRHVYIRVCGRRYWRYFDEFSSLTQITVATNWKCWVSLVSSRSTTVAWISAKWHVAGELALNVLHVVKYFWIDFVDYYIFRFEKCDDFRIFDQYLLLVSEFQQINDINKKSSKRTVLLNTE